MTAKIAEYQAGYDDMVSAQGDLVTVEDMNGSGARNVFNLVPEGRLCREGQGGDCESSEG